ncbi:hypothetical protein BH11BAC5_BH11BAC5_54750 [soil metagenome]
MWQPLTDCAKQLTIHSRLREKLTHGDRLYEITEVEFDQYHLHLLSEDEKPTEDLGQVLSCKQLLAFTFEVEVKE